MYVGKKVIEEMSIRWRITKNRVYCGFARKKL